jgi:hypothetical protein
VPRFFFDIHEGDTHTQDEVGTELTGRHLIPAEARRFLLDVTRDLAITEDRFRVEVSVRADDGGTAIHWTSMLLEAGWLKQ